MESALGEQEAKLSEIQVKSRKSKRDNIQKSKDKISDELTYYIREEEEKTEIYSSSKV